MKLHGSDAPWYRSLAVQTFIFLSIALLPIGLISVWQTREVTEEARAFSALSLRSSTERAVLNERGIVQGALGAAGAFAGMSSQFVNNRNLCQSQLNRYVSGNDRVSEASFVLASGETLCSASGRTPDLAGTYAMEQMSLVAKPTAYMAMGGAESDTPEIRVAHPVLSDSTNGYIVITLIHIAPVLDIKSQGPRFLGAVTSDVRGNIYTSPAQRESLANELPRDGFLASFKPEEPVFRATNGLGATRTYSVAAIVPDALYAVVIWDHGGGGASTLGLRVSPILFPVLMWLASLAVAMFAMNRLVMHHVRDLGQRMRRFGRDRDLRVSKSTRQMSSELMEIKAEFESMAHGILHDEAKLLDTVRSKNVLIKEVHHRVKNNLQLITSIMSIQMRQTENPETREVVGRLQDRVLGLATIHENLYQMRESGRVDASKLLHEIVDNSRILASGQVNPVTHRVHLDPLVLYPDQAAPLSLLMSELMRNALEFNVPDAEGASWIDVSLEIDGMVCTLVVANSCRVEAAKQYEHGVGANLIRAFAAQVGGELVVDAEPDRYVVKVTFEATDFIQQGTDY
ncbi:MULTISPECIES: sensor histidine kinase [unclassified Marinovum]